MRAGAKDQLLGDFDSGWFEQPTTDLRHRQGQQLGIRQLRWPTWPRPMPQKIVDLDVQCRQEGVEVGRHKLTFNNLRPHPATPRR
jgi:hypothetical protein